jgi:Uma2 family endonuclease
MMPLTIAQDEQHFLMHRVSWRTYENLLRELGDRHIFLTYDRGALEIMSPSRKHERVSKIIGRLVEAMTEELGIEISSSGSTTFRREDLEQGLEPDECYWIANEAAVREKDEIDLRIDPPPDLAIEVDFQSSSIDREQVYGALGVPEIWRWKDERLLLRLLQPDGSYATSQRSQSFPFLDMAEFERFVTMRNSTGESALMRAFRAWVRTHRP